MNRGAKQNWFESPHAKNSIWLFHDDKLDLFNSSKINHQQRFTFHTPSHQSRPYEIQKNFKQTSHYHYQNESSKFDDINLPDMFTNTIIQRQVINEKLNFQQQSVISEENDYHTPSRNGEQGKDLPKTAAKQAHPQQKKPRPKQKGLRMLSQKAYEIVTKMNGATYKQVANKLVDELAVQDTVQINGKDQQNIKRRVYDALNVLIALGILKKDGRKIHGLKGKTSHEEERHSEFKRAFAQNQQMKFKLGQKTKQLKNLRQKAQMIKALIKRNRLFTLKENRLYFPFLVANMQVNDENNLKIRPEFFEAFTRTKPVQPMGDIDSLIFMRPSLKAFID